MLIETELNPFFQGGFVQLDSLYSRPAQTGYVGPGTGRARGPIFGNSPFDYALSASGRYRITTIDEDFQPIPLTQLQMGPYDGLATQFGNGYLTSVGTLNPLLRNFTRFPVDVRTPNWQVPFRSVTSFFEENEASFALGLNDPSDYFDDSNSLNYFAELNDFYQGQLLPTTRTDFRISREVGSTVSSNAYPEVQLSYLKYLSDTIIADFKEGRLLPQDNLLSLDSETYAGPQAVLQFLRNNGVNDLSELENTIAIIDGAASQQLQNAAESGVAPSGSSFTINGRTFTQYGNTPLPALFVDSIVDGFPSTTFFNLDNNVFDGITPTRERTLGSLGVASFNLEQYGPVSGDKFTQTTLGRNVNQYFRPTVAALETFGTLDKYKYYWNRSSTTVDSTGAILNQTPGAGLGGTPVETVQFFDEQGNELSEDYITNELGLDPDFFDQEITDPEEFQEQLEEIETELSRRRVTTTITNYFLTGLRRNEKQHFEFAQSELSGYVTNRSLRLLLDYNEKRDQYRSILAVYRPLVGYEPLMTISTVEGETANSLRGYNLLGKRYGLNSIGSIAT